MKITLTGSLGRIGAPLAKALLHKGHTVTIVSHNPERKKEIESLGAMAAIGQAEDIVFLSSTFAGADVVYAMIPPDNTVHDPLMRNKAVGDCLVAAIAQSKTKRVVYVSSYGAHVAKGTGLIAAHHEIEIALDNLPDLEAITHLRATYIYYNLYAYLNMIKTAGFIAANYGGDDVVVMVSPEDIAAAAVEEIESIAKGRKVRYVASDERTCDDIAGILGKAIGKPDLKWVRVTNEQMQNGMESNGLPASVAACFVEMFGAIHTGLLHEDYYKHEPELGGVKIEDFAKEFAVNFK